MTTSLTQIARQRRLIALASLQETAENVVSLARRRAAMPQTVPALTFATTRTPLSLLRAA